MNIHGLHIKRSLLFLVSGFSIGVDHQFITELTHRQSFTLTFTAMGNLELLVALTPLHVFGLWGEAGLPGENMQAPHRKAQAG